MTAQLIVLNELKARRIGKIVADLWDKEHSLEGLRRQESNLIVKKRALIDELKTVCGYNDPNSDVCSHPGRVKKFMSGDYEYKCMTDFCPHIQGD